MTTSLVETAECVEGKSGSEETSYAVDGSAHNTGIARLYRNRNHSFDCEPMRSEVVAYKNESLIKNTDRLCLQYSH